MRRCEEAQFDGAGRGGVEAEENGLAVVQAGFIGVRVLLIGEREAGQGFDGVSEGVAEVEDGARAGGVGGFLALVGCDHGGFDAHAVFHERADPLRTAGERGVEGLQIGPEQRADREVFIDEGAMQQGVLEAFAQPGAEHAGRQRGERVEVREDQRRLPERADDVLLQAGGSREVDTGLAADGGIDHRQQGGRALDDRHAALVGGGDEARDVTGDAAPYGDDGVRAVGAGLGERGEQALDGRDGLVRFERGDALRRDGAAGRGQ